MQTLRQYAFSALSDSTSSGAALHHGRVIARGNGPSVAVACDGLSLSATTAAGCLMRPEIGDLVLVCVTGTTAYVLTVLARGASGEGETVLEMGRGVRLAAVDGALHVKAERATLDFDHCAWANGTLHCSAEDARFEWQAHHASSAHSVEVCGEKREYLGEAVRHVTGHEEHGANSLRQCIAEDWSAQARDISLFGVERVSADTDGDIQLG